MNGVAILVPMLDEAQALPRLIRVLGALHPAPAEIIAVDGGSADCSVALAQAAGWRVIPAARGRAIQINAGVAAARSPLVCVLHADTIPPDDLVAIIARNMLDPTLALGGFTPLICGPDHTRWGISFHNWIKTWYAPLLMRPRLFMRGGRLLFGDHAMFFRRLDFLRIGGCDPSLAVMEEADLCIKFLQLGRTRLIGRVVQTSDRRVTAWGPLRANWVYLKVGVLWGLGARGQLGRQYPDVR